MTRARRYIGIADPNAGQCSRKERRFLAPGGESPSSGLPLLAPRPNYAVYLELKRLAKREGDGSRLRPRHPQRTDELMQQIGMAPAKYDHAAKADFRERLMALEMRRRILCATIALRKGVARACNGGGGNAKKKVSLACSSARCSRRAPLAQDGSARASGEESRPAEAVPESGRRVAPCARDDQHDRLSCGGCGATRLPLPHMERELPAFGGGRFLGSRYGIQFYGSRWSTGDDEKRP